MTILELENAKSNNVMIVAKRFPGPCLACPPDFEYLDIPLKIRSVNKSLMAVSLFLPDSESYFYWPLYGVFIEDPEEMRRLPEVFINPLPNQSNL